MSTGSQGASNGSFFSVTNLLCSVFSEPTECWLLSLLFFFCNNTGLANAGFASVLDFSDFSAVSCFFSSFSGAFCAG